MDPIKIKCPYCRASVDAFLTPAQGIQRFFPGTRFVHRCGELPPVKRKAPPADVLKKLKALADEEKQEKGP